MATQIKELSLQSEFQQTRREFASKALLALAGIVMGVAAILFLATQWAAVGIGLVLLSTYSLYHLADKYHSSKYYLTKANQALASHV